MYNRSNECRQLVSSGRRRALNPPSSIVFATLTRLGRNLHSTYPLSTALGLPSILVALLWFHAVVLLSRSEWVVSLPAMFFAFADL